MGYKLKPNKGIAKRVRVTKNGKVKHRHEKNSHLRSGRSGKLKRKLGRPSVLPEGHARNWRDMMRVSKLKPARARHEREQAARAAETAAAEKTTEKKK